MAVNQNSRLKERSTRVSVKPYQPRVTRRKDKATMLDEEATRIQDEIKRLQMLGVLTDKQEKRKAALSSELSKLNDELSLILSAAQPGRIMGDHPPSGPVPRATGVGKRKQRLKSRGIDAGPGKKAKRQLRKFKAKQRALANTSVTGQDRPLSKLDEQAKELGVYSEAYHNLNRAERKALVSKAYSAAKAAA